MTIVLRISAGRNARIATYSDVRPLRASHGACHGRLSLNKGDNSMYYKETHRLLMYKIKGPAAGAGPLKNTRRTFFPRLTG